MGGTEAGYSIESGPPDRDADQPASPRPGVVVVPLFRDPQDGEVVDPLDVVGGRPVLVVNPEVDRVLPGEQGQPFERRGQLVPARCQSPGA